MAKFLNSLSSLRPFLDDAAKPFLQNNQAYLNAGQSILGGASTIEPMLDEDVNVGNQSTTSGLGMGSACPGMGSGAMVPGNINVGNQSGVSSLGTTGLSDGVSSLGMGSAHPEMGGGAMLRWDFLRKRKRNS